MAFKKLACPTCGRADGRHDTGAHATFELRAALAAQTEHARLRNAFNELLESMRAIESMSGMDSDQYKVAHAAIDTASARGMVRAA